MRVLLDTSVLVAAFIRNHPRHKAASEWLKRAKVGEIEACISAHSALETYSVLTRAPFKPKVSPEAAQAMINRNLAHIQHRATLGATEYLTLIEDLAKQGFTGGVVYDGLLLYCGKKMRVERVITSNPKDFAQLAKALQLEMDIIGI